MNQSWERIENHYAAELSRFAVCSRRSTAFGVFVVFGDPAENMLRLLNLRLRCRPCLANSRTESCRDLNPRCRRNVSGVLLIRSKSGVLPCRSRKLNSYRVTFKGESISGSSLRRVNHERSLKSAGYVSRI